MDNSQPSTRTQTFRWNSRFDLYAWFRDRYGLGKHQVDVEIHRVMATFRPRKNAVIKTQELWQKVGLNLEKAHASELPAESDVLFEVDVPVKKVHETKAISDSVPSKSESGSERAAKPAGAGAGSDDEVVFEQAYSSVYAKADVDEDADAEEEEDDAEDEEGQAGTSETSNDEIAYLEDLGESRDRKLS